jgi:hypothetical protein
MQTLNCYFGLEQSLKEPSSPPKYLAIKFFEFILCFEYVAAKQMTCMHYHTCVIICF